ncbi:MAG: Coenzyme F420 hydrogenase/dehydrogenase, beta subunit C-terminal domain, partial [Candidatus Hodarchaeota archaeon]
GLFGTVSYLMILDFWKDELCTGCGTCAGVCPHHSLEMNLGLSRFVPIQVRACEGCNLCVEACPGISMNFHHLNTLFFGKVQNDPWLGNYIQCYTGNALDPEICKKSSSGGVVTALLCNAIELGLVNGVLLTRMSVENPLKPEVFIARNREEIISGSGSKYCPVPFNEDIRKIRNCNEKFAVVGLPCHIHGLRKTETIDKKLRNKIVFHLGLFCSHTICFNGTTCLLQAMKIQENVVEKLSYRAKGWPGSMQITLKNDGDVFVPASFYWTLFSKFFFPTRCVFCSDGTNELADISFGDAWLPEFSRGKQGTSVIVSRSKKGEYLLKRASSEKKIEIVMTTPQKVKEAAKNMLIFKKRKLRARMIVARLFGISTPNISTFIENPKPSDYISAFWPFLSLYISTNLPSLLRFVISTYARCKHIKV